MRGSVILKNLLCKSFYDEFEEVLDCKTKIAINNLIEKISSNNKYKNNKMQDIKLMLYNNSQTKKII